MKKLDDFLIECNSFQTDHYTITENNFASYMTDLSIYRTDLQTLISSLTEKFGIMDQHYKCYEGCSILTVEAEEPRGRLILYENILNSESLKNYKLSTLQDDLHNISAKIVSLNEKFQLQVFPTEFSSTKSKACIETVIRPLRDKIQALQMKLRQIENMKRHLENKCKEAIYEYQNVISFIEHVRLDIKTYHMPKFKDYSQPQLRKINDYAPMVEMCKSKITKCCTDCVIKKENIQTKELFSKKPVYLKERLEIF